MQKTRINKGKILLGTMLMLVIVQLFSIHLHFEHVEQAHDIHVHSFLSVDHHLVEEGESEHGEEGDFDLMGGFGKKFSSFNLLVIFSFILILPIMIQKHLVMVDVHRLHWQYRHFFFPHLRAPPLNP